MLSFLVGLLFSCLQWLILNGLTRSHAYNMTTTICKNPSANAAALISSSTGAPIGTTAPCNTGVANTGFLLLGNTVGNI